MESQYNSFIQELFKIRDEKASTFENSLLYQKEITSFMNELLSLKNQYTNVTNNINTMQEKYKINNYQKIFSYIDDAQSEVNILIENINTIEKRLKDASLANYTAMENDFINLYKATENEINAARKNLDNYNFLTNELNNLNPNDPSYNNNFTLIDRNRDENGEQANICLSNVRNKITKLYEYLEKGLKRV